MSLLTIAPFDAPTEKPTALTEDSGWAPFFKLLMFVMGALLSWGALALPWLSFAAVV
jgi:hypothetical protein